MEINHDKTRDLIFKCLQLIGEQAKAAQSYRERYIKLCENKDYTQDYINKRIEETRNEYIQAHEDTKTSIIEMLDEVAEAELANESISEFDIPEFANTMNSIHITSGKLPADVIETIIKNNIGRYQVLNVIQTALEGYGIDIKPYNFPAYASSVAVTIPPLKLQTESMELSPQSTCVYWEKLFDNLMTFAANLGVAYEDKKFDIEIEYMDKLKEEIAEKQARTAMGLD